MIYSKIIGTGSYLPKQILTNTALEKIVDTNDAWIFERTGIRSRHIAELNQGETCNFLATQAAKQALLAAQIDPNDIGLIIVATCSADQHFPSTACYVQHELGIQSCPAFDIGAACAGFVYALGIADQFIRTGAVHYALVIGSEVMSRLVDWQDRSTCILFGDGAGAIVLGKSDQPGILSTHMQAEGRYGHLLNASPLWNKSEIGYYEPSYIQMRGNEVFKLAVNKLGDIVDTTLNANGLNKAQLDWLVPHQANMRIINALAKKLELPIEQVVVTIAEHGNTSAASVPLALDTAIRDGRIQRGQTMLLESFGAGFAWASALIVY